MNTVDLTLAERLLAGKALLMMTEYLATTPGGQKQTPVLESLAKKLGLLVERN